MKIGIVTIYDFFNHGNRLQNFALQKVLQNRNYEVDSLLISPKKIYTYSSKLMGLFPFVPFVRRVYNSKKQSKRVSNIKFIDFYTNKKLKNLNNKYNAFIVGSDQVWNPEYIVNENISFLQFANENKTIAYAPSFGVANIDKKYKERFEKGLLNIKYLSCREDTGVKLIKEIANKDASLVLDPTILLSKKEWEDSYLEIVDKKPKKYILTYFLGNSKELIKKAKLIAKENNLNIINLNNSFCKFYNCNSAQFLDLINNAELVCTNSFHGTVFSIIFNKPFIYMPSIINKMSRISNLLKLTNLENRIYNNLSKKDYFKIDFSYANNILEQERNKSLSFLFDACENIEKFNKNLDKSIKIDNKENCCGCSACFNICPKKCISMEYDDEGFLYPKIDETKCIHCGLCKKVCPILNKIEHKCDFPKAYAVKNINEEVRLNSTSGGMFSVIAEYVLNKNGVVFGAGFDDDFNVCHQCIDSLENLNKLRVSKYVQSKISNTYFKAKEYLVNGKLVLFTGTPCQIAGLKSYLGKEYNNLITQDIVCMGVPSPILWKNYVNYLSKGKDIKEISFRKKIPNKKSSAIFYKFSNKEVYILKKTKDVYFKLFAHKRCLRPSCHKCAFKGDYRDSDFTLADFWGLDKVRPNFFDDKGVSLVILRTLQAEKIFNEIKDKIIFLEVPYEEAIKHNPMIRKSAFPLNRKSFFKDYKKMPFDKLMIKYIKKPW